MARPHNNRSANCSFVISNILSDNEEIPLSYDLESFLLDFPPSNTTQSKPTNGLLWERKLYLRPLPDDNDGSNYVFEMPKVDVPTSLSADGDQPAEELWGPALAYGAAIDIHLDKGETEQAADKGSILESYITLIFRKDVASEIGRSAEPSF